MPSPPLHPVTTMFGPNRSFHPYDTNLRILLQLHNLLPGATWNPAFQAELTSPVVLSPMPFPIVWGLNSPNFQWRFHWHTFSITRNPPYPTERIELYVRALPLGETAFRYFVRFLVNQPLINDTTGPADNFSYGGTATMSWFKV